MAFNLVNQAATGPIYPLPSFAVVASPSITPPTAFLAVAEPSTASSAPVAACGCNNLEFYGGSGCYVDPYYARGSGGML